MLPVVWAAWKGAGIAGKALSIGLPIVLVGGAYWVGNWRGDDAGYERCQQEHAQAALRQAKQVVAHTAKQAELPAEVLQGFLKEREEAAKVRATLEQRNRKYERERQQRQEVIPTHVEESTDEHATACINNDPLDQSFVARWDDIGRMFLEETDTEDDGPSTDRNPSGVSGLPATEVQTSTLIRARTNEFDEYRKLLDNYNGLREFSKGVYILQKIWHNSQGDER